MNILVINVHSALNLGDDAIMHSTLAGIRTIHPTAHVSIAANDPSSWKKYPEVEILSSLCTFVSDCRIGIWRNKIIRLISMPVLLILAAVLYRAFGISWYFGNNELRELLRSYYQADLVLSCGGGNFYAHRSASPAFIWALLTLAFAQALGKKTIMLPQSVGPVQGRFQRFFARFVFQRVHTLMVRESQSIRFIRDELRLDTACVLSSDMAFGLPPAEGKPPSESNAPRIGVTLINRGLQDPNFKEQTLYEDSIARILIDLNKKIQARIEIFAQCYGPSEDQDDRGISRTMQRRLATEIRDVTFSDNYQGAVELKRDLGNMDLILGSRLHTGVFALSQAIPVVLIGYQPKSAGIMHDFGLDRYCIPIEAIGDGRRLMDLLLEALENRTELSRRISARYQETISTFNTWIQYLA
jgi:colanic acid/amylovoran biosynthesis protein